MLDLGPAFDSLGLADQQIAFLFQKIVAEDPERLGQLFARIAAAPEVLDGGDLDVAAEFDARHEADDVGAADIESVGGDYFFHYLLELGVFDDETYQVVQQVGEQVALRVLELRGVLLEILGIPFSIQIPPRVSVLRCCLVVFNTTLLHRPSLILLNPPLRVLADCNREDGSAQPRVAHIDHGWLEEAVGANLPGHEIVRPNES